VALQAPQEAWQSPYGGNGAVDDGIHGGDFMLRLAEIWM